MDNTNIYVPDGWQRQLFKLLSGVHIGKHRICYTSPYGRQVWGKKQMELETAQVTRTVEFTHRAKYLRHSNRFPLKVLNIQREKVPLFGPVSSLNNSIYSHNSKPKWSFFFKEEQLRYCMH